MSPVDHVGLEKFPISDISIVSFKFAKVFNLLKFCSNKWMIQVTLGMNQCEDIVTIFPSILTCEPTGRLGQKDNLTRSVSIFASGRQKTYAKEEENGGQHLKTPWDTKGSRTRDKGATVGDVKHDQNTPGNGPLLSADNTATFTGRRQFGDIDRNLSRADTDSKTIDKTTNDKHANVLRGANDGGTNDPDETTDLNSPLAAKNVREETRSKSADKGTTGHGSSDTTLSARSRTTTILRRGSSGIVGSLIKVAFVLICSKTGGGQHQVGPPRRSTYMADMEAISKPNNPPPTTAMDVMR